MNNDIKFNENNIDLKNTLKNAFGNSIIASKRISTNDNLIEAIVSQY